MYLGWRLAPTRWAALYSALLLAAVSVRDTHQAVCHRSGYCSTGTVPGYIGPLDTAQQLTAALANTHFKREIIFTVETRVEPASQFVAQYWAAGYGHVLVIMSSSAECQRLNQVFDSHHEAQLQHGKLSCGWYKTTNATWVDGSCAASIP